MRFLAVCAAAGVCAVAAAAQYPGQIDAAKTSAPTLRAVAVLEWTGDLAHPKASRLVPISIWDGQELHDAGIYLARPQPLALDSETEYELQKDGRNIGLFDVNGASETQDTWYGQGTFKPLPHGPTPQQLAAAAARQKVDMDDADSDEPVLHRKPHPDDSENASANSGPPVLHKRSNAHADGDNNPSAPPPDPDRPRLSGDEDSSQPAANSGNGAITPGNDVAYVSDLPRISDPDRPRLVYGAPAESGPAVKPLVVGLPSDLSQAVAISDARPVQEHAWDYSWANAKSEAKIKADLEAIARKALAEALGSDRLGTAADSKQSAARHASAHRRNAHPTTARIEPLLDEHFRAFELQYGGGATFVFSARTAGAGEQEKFITLIAQPDLYGNVTILFKNLTDAAHLDLAPRMRLIDAVDALGDNRGELLFELRGKTGRQFALYRVLRGQVMKIFTTSPGDWATATD